jgi:hypothetical protein
MLEKCQQVAEMTPWYILILVAVVGAMATTVFNRYFAISVSRPPAAYKLINSITETLAWSENPENTVGIRDDVSQKAFCNFLSSCWPWEQKKLLTLWLFYHRESGGVIAKGPLLRELLALVNKYSGFA